ncbi:retinol dehydrogenase 8-like [Lytechinus pictus]|uniref:retinol dehydrogenase 8-like n=1 Tax=Lytechinus pictus TaxID=7653 RepID=UPI0030BA021B
MAPLVTLITGCSTGIGLTTAVKLAKDANKYIVYATMRNLAKKGDLEQAAGSALNDTLFIRQLDITKEESIVDAVKTIKEKHGKVDILVNNAAFGWMGPLEEMTMAHMRNMSETNIVGTYRMTQEVIPIMKQQRSGRIVNISSLGGINGFPFSEVYSATKFAMEGFTEALHPVLKCFNVKISTVCPGPVLTSFQENMSANQDPEAKSSDAEDPTKKMYTGFIGALMAPMKAVAQSSDEIADVIIDCIKSEDPALRCGTNESTNKRLRDRFNGGIGDAAAQNWYKMMQTASKH